VTVPKRAGFQYAVPPEGLRAKVSELEHEVGELRRRAEAAEAARQIARKSAEDAWRCVRELRGVPVRRGVE